MAVWCAVINKDRTASLCSLILLLLNIYSKIGETFHKHLCSFSVSKGRVRLSFICLHRMNTEGQNLTCLLDSSGV